jgi:hypothetical protein
MPQLVDLAKLMAIKLKKQVLTMIKLAKGRFQLEEECQSFIVQFDQPKCEHCQN